jgi:hypothetical protein
MTCDVTDHCHRTPQTFLLLLNKMLVGSELRLRTAAPSLERGEATCNTKRSFGRLTLTANQVRFFGWGTAAKSFVRPGMCTARNERVVRGRTVRPMRRGPGWVLEYSRCASRGAPRTEGTVPFVAELWTTGAPPQPYRIVNGDMCLARRQGVGPVLCRRRSSGCPQSTHRISFLLLLGGM